jgi:hypothetical protein
MSTTKSEATRQQEFVAAAEAMYVRLRQWRAGHLAASFDEVGNQVTQERQRLMAILLGELAAQPEEVLGAAEVCSHCGKELVRKGKQARGVSHLEGEVRFAREYHYCDECQSGLFPPRPPIAADQTCLESADD